MSSCREKCSELLPEYIRGSLDPVENEKVRDHLGRCPECALEARVLEQLDSGPVPDPDPWFFDSLPGKVTAEITDRSRNKRRLLIPVWVGGLAAAALVMFMILRTGPTSVYQAGLTGLDAVENSGYYSLGLEEELLPVSGTILDDLDRQFVQDLGVLPSEYIASSDIIPEGDGYEKMDDETIRLFEDLVEELTPVEERKKVMS